MLTLVSSFYKGHTLCHIYSVTLMLLFVMCPIQVFDNASPVWDDPTHCLAKIHYKFGVGSPSYPTNPHCMAPRLALEQHLKILNPVLLRLKGC